MASLCAWDWTGRNARSLSEPSGRIRHRRGDGLGGEGRGGEEATFTQPPVPQSLNHHRLCRRHLHRVTPMQWPLVVKLPSTQLTWAAPRGGAAWAPASRRPSPGRSSSRPARGARPRKRDGGGGPGRQNVEVLSFQGTREHLVLTTLHHPAPMRPPDPGPRATATLSVARRWQPTTTKGHTNSLSLSSSHSDGVEGSRRVAKQDVVPRSVHGYAGLRRPQKYRNQFAPGVSTIPSLMDCRKPPR